VRSIRPNVQLQSTVKDHILTALSSIKHGPTLIDQPIGAKKRDGSASSDVLERAFWAQRPELKSIGWSTLEYVCEECKVDIRNNAIAPTVHRLLAAAEGLLKGWASCLSFRILLPYA
jgi:hypothetical protein